MLAVDAENRSHAVTIFEWLPFRRDGRLNVSMAFLADPLSITMCLFVTGIGTLIHLYAVGYMHGDPKFSKFFIYMNLFAFSMLMLVLGREPARHVPRLGGRGHVLVPADLVLAHEGVGGDGGKEGVRHQPGRGLGLHGGDVPRLLGDRLAELRRCSTAPRRRARSGRRRRPRSPRCCSSARSARAPSCRCTSGCRTRWRVRRPYRR